MMRAITYERFGAAQDVLELKELPTPDPAPGEVRVRLMFSGVNPSDVKARAGTRPGVTKPAFPLIIPHSDGAGEIEAVGAGVDPARLGQRVWTWNGQWQRSQGTAASHITLSAEQAVPMPDKMHFETGATLGIPGLTACHAVFGGGDITGQTLLVQGGSGTVGLLAVQLARWGGATVIATCSGKDRDRVSEAGAHHVFDYRDEDLVSQVLAANAGQHVNQVIEVEFGMNISTDAEVIAPSGRIAAYGSAQEMSPQLPFGPLLFKAATIDIILIYLLQISERDRAIARLHAASEQKALNCPTHQIYTLKETAQAHRVVEAANRSGSVLIDCQT